MNDPDVLATSLLSEPVRPRSQKNSIFQNIFHGIGSKKKSLRMKNKHLSRFQNERNQSALNPYLNLRETWNFQIVYPKNKIFGAFLGVFLPVLINLICVTYFLNLPQFIHELGWLLSVGFFFVSFFVSCCTVGSICVIATNGEMQDGGCYYLISRTLGPELGAATGITLAIAHATAISARLHFVSDVITMFYDSKPFLKSLRWDRTVLHLGLCIVVFFIGLPGLKFVVIFLAFLVVFIFLGIIFFVIGFFDRKPLDPKFFTGLSLTTYAKNFHFPAGMTFLNIIHTFGLLFPTANAVMTCANFSGCLKCPQRSIPTGAFSALSIGAVLILIALFLESGSFNYDNLSESEIKYMPFTISKSSLLTEISFISSCIGSALTMTTGGARILTQMVNDGLLPTWLKKWNLNGEDVIPHIFITLITFVFAFIDEPTTSTLVTNLVFLIPFALINFAVYMASTANYPGFRPSFMFFNPYFSLFLAIFCITRMFLINWILALVTLGIFFIIYGYWIWKKPTDVYGTVTQSKIYYSTLKEELDLYHVKPHAKTYRPNILFVTTVHPDERRNILDLITELLHGYGMAAVGRVFIKPSGKIESLDYKSIIEERDGTRITSSSSSSYNTSYNTTNFNSTPNNYLISNTTTMNIQNQIKRKMGDFFSRNSQYKDTFYDVTIASSFHEGVRDFLLLMGIGMMRPNVLCLNYPIGWQTGNEFNFPAKEFFKSLLMTTETYYGAIVLRNSDLFEGKNRDGNIDVWWNNDDGGLTLLIPYILSKNRNWKKAKLRVFSVAQLDKGETVKEKQNFIASTLAKVRISAEVVTVVANFSEDEPDANTLFAWNRIMDDLEVDEEERMDPVSKKYMIMSELLKRYSSDSSFVVMTLPLPTLTDNYRTYMSWLEIMSQRMIDTPFCFIRGNGENTLSWKM